MVDICQEEKIEAILYRLRNYQKIDLGNLLMAEVRTKPENHIGAIWNSVHLFTDK
jgi:hypothetical protein